MKLNIVLALFAVCLGTLIVLLGWLLSSISDGPSREQRELQYRAGALAACGPEVLPIDITDEGFYWKVICPDPKQGQRVVIYEEDAS